MHWIEAIWFALVRDIIKAIALSIKSHNLGTNPLPTENNVKNTLSVAQVSLDRDWVIPPSNDATTVNSTKTGGKTEVRKWTWPFWKITPAYKGIIE